MRRALVLILALALLPALAACGAGTGSGPGDPAKIAPPSTLAYATFEIHPQGDAKAGFDAAFGKLLGADPEDKLGEAFTNAASTSGKLDYAADVKPWLGETLSMVVTRVGRGDCDYALLAASTDDAKAQAAIDKDAAGAATRSYRDVSYKVLGDGTVNGIVDHFLVAGTEPTFKAVVDAAKDGKSLADTDAWQASVGNRGDGKVGLAYIDAKGLIQSFMSGLPGLQSVAGPLLVGSLQLNPFVATLDAGSDSLIADVSSPGTKPDPRGPAAASSPLIESMPSDAWLALAVPQVGEALQRLTATLKANPLIGAQLGAAVARVRAQTGVDLQKLIGAIGDLGLFVRGATPRTVGGALVVSSHDPTTVTGAAKALATRIPARVARKLRVRNSGDRAVVGYGAAALGAAFKPAGRLADLAAFKKAVAVIGGRPTLFVNFPTALELAAKSPHHRGDAHFRRALPRLRHIEYIAAGARRDGGLDVVRGVVGLR